MLIFTNFSFLFCICVNILFSFFLPPEMQVAVNAGVFELLDNLAFYDFEKVPTSFKTMNERWSHRSQPIPFAGEFK